jgi:hypothetical protein
LATSAMKFVATRPCEFYVDQLFNLHGNDELYAQMFVPIVARALQRQRFPDAAELSWAAWYAAWKALTPTAADAGACAMRAPTRRADVDVRDWGMALFFYDAASDRRGETRWAKRTLAVLRRG